MTDQTPDAARGNVLARMEHDWECDSETLMQGPCNCDRESFLDAYAAAVARARDTAWREAVEAVRPQQPIGVGIDRGPSLYVLDVCDKLDRILARMTQQEPTDV
jgi:hypothetical protein